MSAFRPRLFGFALQHATLLLFLAVLAFFGAQAPRFLAPDNLLNVLVQTSAVALVGTGMTFVLITGGVDLSVGAVMFLGGALAAKMLIAGQPLGLALATMLGLGLVWGALNALFITSLRIAAFIVTLALLFIGRGLALWLTETRAMNLPESFLDLGSTRALGVPVPLWIAVGVVFLAQGVLSHTPFGRQLYAVGHHRENARKAGLNPSLLLVAVYVISGGCAALGGIVSLAQLGAVSPRFGLEYEFKAIAAAVLGGTSLFGGRGKVFPGTVLGAVLIQSVENGLNILNVDPYLYPLITSAIIFVAVLLDTVRGRLLATAQRRRIRNEVE